MNSTMKYIGLDVSKEKISVAIAERGGSAARYWGIIRNDLEEVARFSKMMGDPDKIAMCYEAGPTGYGLCRYLRSIGIRCIVVAPSLIPQQPGNRVKTDRRDAVRLAQLFRAGELTSVWVPEEEDEALRDLVRAREDAREDLLRARQRLSKFFLRHGLKEPSGMKRWSSKHKAWLKSLGFESSALQNTFMEYTIAIEEIESRIQRLESEIHVQAEHSPHAPLIKALQALRGIREVSAATIVAEVGYFSRFTPPRLMAYAGLVPSEHSSGAKKRRGGITNAGNSHLRRIVVESAWSYRYRPAITPTIKKRQEGQLPSVCAIAWKAQIRLHKKYWRLVSKGRSGSVAATAVAREFLGFIWAIAREVEYQQLYAAHRVA